MLVSKMRIQKFTLEKFAASLRLPAFDYSRPLLL